MFPWKAGGATSACVDASGDIYLAGATGENVKLLKADPQKVEPIDVKSPPTLSTYLARIDRGGTKLVWAKTFAGPSSSPTVRITKSGKIEFAGPDLRIYDPSGKAVDASSACRAD